MEIGQFLDAFVVNVGKLGAMSSKKPLHVCAHCLGIDFPTYPGPLESQRASIQVPSGRRLVIDAVKNQLTYGLDMSTAAFN